MVNFSETVGPSAMGVEEEDDAMGEASRCIWKNGSDYHVKFVERGSYLGCPRMHVYIYTIKIENN
jgi:hypothetical protein